MANEKPLADVWVTRDFSVLTHITARFDQGERDLTDEDIAQAIAFDVMHARLASRSLERRGFIHTTSVLSGTMHVDDVAGAAYLVTGPHGRLVVVQQRGQLIL